MHTAGRRPSRRGFSSNVAVSIWSVSRGAGPLGLIVDRRIGRRLAAPRHGAVERERPELWAHRDDDVLRAVQLDGRRRAWTQPCPFLGSSGTPNGGFPVRTSYASTCPPGEPRNSRPPAVTSGPLVPRNARRHLLLPDHASRPGVDGGQDADRVGQRQVEPGGVPDERIGEAARAADMRLPLRVDVAGLRRERHGRDPHQRNRHTRCDNRLLVDRRRRVAAAVELERRRHPVAPVRTLGEDALGPHREGLGRRGSLVRVLRHRPFLDSAGAAGRSRGRAGRDSRRRASRPPP